MSDVYLFATNDGGDIEITPDGDVVMHDKFEVAAYLSLFGGNMDDDGSAENPSAYWQNLIEIEEAPKLVSRTQYLLRTLPITVPNLQRVRRAAVRDLQWFLDRSVASVVEVAVSVPQLNRVTFDIRIEADGEEQNFSFTENWKAPT